MMGYALGDVGALRSRAIDLVRTDAWAELLELQPDLEQDDEYWLGFWGPACAVAAHHLGHEDARRRLVALIDAGFYDLRTHADLFSESFARDPGWDELRARMQENTPRPPVELTRWPTASPAQPLALDRLPPTEERRLAERVPPRTGSAQDTALATLAWVTGRWRHSSANHVPGRDANLVLDRVEAGERFACREFTIVLTQALNALGIPARHLALFCEDYHAGIGTGHAVTEAWLDDVGRWVVLDGQNGATWRDPQGALLGVPEVNRLLAAGDRPQFAGSGPNHDPTTADEWLTYFRHCSPGGATWRSGSFVPLMEGRSVVPAKPLLRSAEPLYPDLAEQSTSVVDDGGHPAVVLGTDHPYATGFSLRDGSGTTRVLEIGEPARLEGAPGQHEWLVGTRTAYGDLRASTLTYTVSG